MNGKFEKSRNVVQQVRGDFIKKQLAKYLLEITGKDISNKDR